MNKLVHFFDVETRVYKGSKRVALDPQGNEPIYPKDHPARTYVNPPSEKVGFVRVWSKEKQTWSYVENHDK